MVLCYNYVVMTWSWNARYMENNVEGQLHDDVIKCKHFPRYWPFVGVIHRSPQKPVSFDVFFDLRLNQRLSKQSWGWWFETLLCTLWRHCNAFQDSSRFVVFMSFVSVLSVREITKSRSTFSATNISSNIVWLLQLHDTIQMESIFCYQIQ